MTAGIYARISLDRHDGEGVARQLADCHQLADERGWSETVEYVDNDISAFRAHRRPGYTRLLADLTAGNLAAVIAYHPDRLYRRPADLEAFIDAVQGAGADVATVRAGDVDLSSASGRMVARILGAVSRQDSERIGERVSRSKQQRAMQGRPAGGGRRPFGLTDDRTELITVEAQALREVAGKLIGGASWSAVADWLNGRGIRKEGGTQWSITDLRRTLTSPHVAGLRSYHGEIVGDATWPPILDRGTWEIIRASASLRRRGRPASGKHLLTGFLTCSLCGRPLWINGPASSYAYRCSPAPSTRGRGCGKISITAHPLEQHVTATLAGWLARPAFVEELDAYLAYGDITAAGAAAELDELDRKMVTLATRWADGRMMDDEYDAARLVLAQRRAETEASLGAGRRRTVTVDTGVMAKAWDGATTIERRDLIPLLLASPVPVLPGRDTAGVLRAVGERVELRPVWE